MLAECGLLEIKSSVGVQMVVVTEPRLVAELLHCNDLAKPTQPVMAHFRQLMSPSGKADFLSAEGDAEDWLWKVVRRGVAPAFAPRALRCRQACQTTCRAHVCNHLCSS